MVISVGNSLENIFSSISLFAGQSVTDKWTEIIYVPYKKVKW